VTQSAIIPIIVIAFIALAIIIILIQSPGESKPHLLYEKNFSILSAMERSFLKVLEPMLGDKYLIYAKVRLVDIIKIRPKPDHELSAETMAKINNTTVSFVLCNTWDHSIAGIIDLANKTRTTSDDDMPDDFIDNAALEAELPLVRVPSRLQYNPEDISDILAKKIELPKEPADHANANKYGDCPSCGEPLTLLKAKHGENIGKYFLGCSNYPECKYLSMLNDNETEPTVANALQPIVTDKTAPPKETT